MKIQPNNFSQYTGVQSLRFIAAVLVVISHATLAVVERLNITDFPIWRNGGVGVSIFFVISGFVMVISSQKLLTKVDGAKIFIKKRLIRIVPMYWLATTAKLFAVLLIPAATLHSSYDFWHVFSSYFFLPFKNVEGLIKPLHAVGWTLTYEMFFYGLFGLLIFLRKPPVLYISVIFCSLIGLGMFVDLKDWTALFFYSQIITLQFVMGMFLGILCLRNFKVHPMISLAFIVFGLVKVITQTYGEDNSIWEGFLNWGLPSALIVAGAAFLEPSFKKFAPTLLLRLGDGSYSLYLFHPFIVPGFAALLSKFGLQSPLIAIITLLSLSVVICQLIYVKIEKPITVYLSKKNS